VTLARSSRKDEAKDSLVLFTLQGERYSIENTSIVQILNNLSITQVANATPYLLGSTVFQGEVLPVIDLKIFFYGKNNVPKDLSGNSRPIFVVIDYQGKTVVFLVQTIIGIISRTSEIFSMDIHNFIASKEKQFYKSVFLWEEQMTVQLNIETIFERLRTELHQNQSLSFADLNLNLSSIDDPEILEEFNIDLQHKMTSKPTSGWSIDRLIKQPEEQKYTGTIITVNDISILVPNDSLEQVFNISELTKVPNSTKTIMGIINYHGEIINVINLSKLLSEPQEITKSNEYDQIMKMRALILVKNNQKLALFVDSLPEIIEIDENEIRKTLILNKKENPDYIFDGAIVDKSEQIVLILNVNYLFKRFFTIDQIEDSDPQVISFNNPKNVSFKKVSESSQEGLIFEDGGYIYFVDSEFVKQVMVQDSFLYKNFNHDAIVGATTYWDTMPLMDFNSLLQGKKSDTHPHKKSLGILLHDPKSGIEATFLINNIIGRVSIDKFEAFQPETSFYTKMLSRMISGFFSFQESLGIIVNPICLLEEAHVIIKNELKIRDVKNEFISTLLENEREILKKMVIERKEREPLLFSRPESTRLEYFIFQWGDSMIAIDVSMVLRVVISSLEIRIVEPTFHPIIGTVKLEHVEQPILDLNSIVMSDDYRVNSNTESYFSLLNGEYSFLVPVDNLVGVIPTFKEDLQPCEESSKFLEGSECCRHKFNNDSISSPMYIIENDFLMQILTQNKIKTSYKELNIQKTNIED
jgi:chemotaxis signal transduction protein